MEELGLPFAGSAETASTVLAKSLIHAGLGQEEDPESHALPTFPSFLFGLVLKRQGLSLTGVTIPGSASRTEDAEDPVEATPCSMRRQDKRNLHKHHKDSPVCSPHTHCIRNKKR